MLIFITCSNKEAVTTRQIISRNWGTAQMVGVQKKSISGDAQH